MKYVILIIHAWYASPQLLKMCIFFFFRYFKAGGNPEQVVHLLSERYTAVAQTANLMADMLISAGMEITHFYYASKYL